MRTTFKRRELEQKSCREHKWEKHLFETTTTTTKVTLGTKNISKVVKIKIFIMDFVNDLVTLFILFHDK